MSKQIVVDMKGIDKVYPNGVVANSKIDFQVEEGEIHALMGENGAGKSTLMKILFGIETPSGGEIFINGKPETINTSTKAISLGIGMVHQHFMLVPNLTVTENIVLGMEPTKKNRFIDYDFSVKSVAEVCEKYNFKVDPKARIRDLSVGQKQKVEILKALYRGAKILILDEPTAVLTPQETEELFEQLKALSDSGHTIIFISHKINEIKSICKRISIMRSGKMIGVYNVADMTIESISSTMVGRDVVREIEKKPAKKLEALVKVTDLKVVDDEGKTIVNDVTMNIHAGHILGIAGVEGNGQREFVDCLTGLKKPDGGSILLKDHDISKDNIKDIRKRGLAHIPEDRIKYGCALGESIEDNLVSDRYDDKAYNKGILLDSKKMSENAEEMIKRFRIVTDSRKTPCRMLSGGNMQKVVAAREMTSDLSVLVADQPTRGIDIGAASFIHDMIVELRDEGKAILLVSADINEVMELSDSLAVFYDGEITGYFEDASKATEEELGLYMLGLRKMTPEQMEGLIR